MTDSKENADGTDSSNEIKITIIDTDDDEMAVLVRGESPGFLRGKYIIGDEIGSGSFAKVREIVDMRTLRRCAVKMLGLGKVLKGFSEYRASEIRKLKREAHLLSRLRHENVLRVYEYFSDEKNEELSSWDKYIWIVMEYCMACVTELMPIIQEEPLEVRTPLPLWQAQHYFRQLIEGLEYLHCHHIVHFDIKPENMLVNNDHVIKITDFGNAKQVDTFDTKGKIDLHRGSPIFEAPELHDEKYKAHSEGYRLDIYSAGVTLFNMVSGLYPFEPLALNKKTEDPKAAKDRTLLVESPMARQLELVELIVKSPYKVPKQLKDSPGLHHLIDGLLTKNPSNRLSIAELKRDPWFNLLIEQVELAKIPPRKLQIMDLKDDDLRFGDHYRSTTITPYLHNYHYPLPKSQKEFKTIGRHVPNFERRASVPYTRANRTPPRSRSPSPGHNHPSHFWKRMCALS